MGLQPQEFLIAREAELEQLRRAFSRVRSVGIVGPAGTGKTALAYLFAEIFREAFTDPASGGRVFFASAMSENIEGLLERLVPRPIPSGCLLIVDDADSLTSAGLGHLRRLLKNKSDLRLLAIARRLRPISALVERQINLRRPTQDEFAAVLHYGNGGVGKAVAARLFVESRGALSFASVANRALRSGFAPSWHSLTELLQDFETSGILGPDGRPVRPDAEAPPQIVAHVSAINEELLARLAGDPQALWTLPPRRFEELVAELLARQGYDVSLTPASGDGGFDIYAARLDGLGQFLYLVECKRYVPPNKVGVEVVRSLYGVVQAQRATAGAVVSTSYFTSCAEHYRRQVQHQMHLHDYLALRKWLNDLQFPRSKA